MKKTVGPCEPSCSVYRPMIERSLDPATWTRAELLTEYRQLYKEHAKLDKANDAMRHQLKEAKERTDKIDALPGWLKGLLGLE